MSPLSPLQHRLAAFRQKRRWARWVMGWSAIGLAGLGLAIVLFLLDVRFEFGIAQRVAMLLLALVGWGWSVRRWGLPWLGVRETETDVALFVESQNRIDSDLVAALQFAHTGPDDGSSPALRSAVIRRMAEAESQLDLQRGFDTRPVIRRAAALGLLVLLVVVITLAAPRYVSVFLSRMLALSARHYPSATTMETIAVNGATVWEWNGFDARPRDARCAQNRPVRFVVACTGELPDEGTLQCRSMQHDTTRTVALRRLGNEDRATGAAGLPASDPATVLYVAELPRLVEAFEYTVRLGDAWTDPAEIQVIVPPLVDVELQVTPPAYAANAERRVETPRHLAVLEGSRIAFRLQSLPSALSGTRTPRADMASVAGKPLQSATIRIDAAGSVSSHELVNPSGDRLTWTLPAQTPFDAVTTELRWEVRATDRDGMSLEAPLQGLVQLKVDRPPTATATVVHQVVLPQAKPVIEFRLHDDYGIAQAVLHGEIERVAARMSDQGEIAPSAADRIASPIPLDPLPGMGQNLPLRGKWSLDLAPYQLVKGDRLKLTLAVVDHRGDLEGQTGWSEPILLEISDEAGVLAAITEADERSEKRLGDVIQQQMGVGGRR